ncbi:MAG: hypothetical protein SPJ93_03855, partial [Treponema sp.]|nr:hypothetical protein [Treponema sp.]
CARRFLGYRNYYNAALAAAPKKVFLPCVSLPRANFYENIFYNAFALDIFFDCKKLYIKEMNVFRINKVGENS